MFNRGLHRAQFFKSFVFQAHSLQYQNALKYSHISKPVSISKTAMSLNSTVQIQLWHFCTIKPRTTLYLTCNWPEKHAWSDWYWKKGKIAKTAFLKKRVFDYCFKLSLMFLLYSSQYDYVIGCTWRIGKSPQNVTQCITSFVDVRIHK